MSTGEEWRDALIVSGEKKTIVPCLENVRILLQQHPDLAGTVAFDAFRMQRTKLRAPVWGGVAGRWQDVDTERLSAWIHRHVGAKIGVETVQSGVNIAAEDARFDPLRDEFLGFPWDGIERCAGFLTTYFGCPDTEYVRAVSQMFLIALAARALSPGCKVDTMLILEGRQGARKSSGLRALAGAGFSDTQPEFGQKDAMVSLWGVSLMEIAELDGLRRAEAQTVKAFISKQEDTFRPPYGRELVCYPRRCVFVGTTNDSNYLQDPTGARRFWPVTVGAVDVAGIERDRALILGEAVALFYRGVKWWIDDADSVASDALDEQAQRHLEHPWMQPIAAWLAERTETQRTNGCTTYDVMLGALGFDAKQIKRGDSMIVGQIMQDLGWQRGIQKRNGAARLRPYFPGPAADAYAGAQDVAGDTKGWRKWS